MSGANDRTLFSRRALVRRVALAAAVVPAGSVLAACAAPAAAPAPTQAPAQPAQPAAKPTEAPKPAATQPPSGAGAAAAATPLAQSTRNPEATLVRFYTSTAAANLPFWRDGVAAFEKKYPKIQVEIEHTPGQPYWDKLTVAFAGGTAPDVIYGAPLDCARVANQGMLLDLSQNIKDDKFPLEDINAATQRPYMWGGKVYGIAAFNDTRYTIYNKTMFKEAGLPELPQTWDGDFSIETFLEYCKKLTNPSKQTWGYVFESNGQAARMSWLFGANYYDSQDYPTKAVMDSPEGIAGFQWIQDLVHVHKVAPSVAENMGGSDPMFQTGKVGMIWGGFKSAAAIHRVIKNFEWGISTIPKGKVRVSNLSPNGFMIISKSKVVPQAWALVKYITADEGAAILSQSTSMPANKNVDFAKVSPLQPWENKLLQDALKTGRSEVPHPNIKPQFGTIINEEMDQLMAKTKTGEQVAKDMAKRINAVFQPYVVPQ